MLTRRGFMAMLGTLGLSTVIGNETAAKEGPIDYYPIIVSAVDKENIAHGRRKMSSRERENLAYACDAIRPSNHVELSIVIGLGPRWMPYRKHIDEYVRRRDGLSSQSDDHPFLVLDKYVVPDTQRVLIFREQLLKLIAKLTGMNNPDSLLHLRKYMQTRADIPPLKEVSMPAYRQRFTDEEFALFERVLRGNAATVLPFAYCSTMACRVEMLAKG